MKYLDVTFAEPADNLALDEVLLDLCEQGEMDGVIRFWEPGQYFVVLGHTNRRSVEVHEDACIEDGVPILRRHSGGGTVLQGPGCLNFALVLPLDSSGTFHSISSTNGHVLNLHARAIEGVVGGAVEFKGSSDLTMGGRKFSGNAQRRRQKAILFHGTFLLEFAIPKIGRYLGHPSKEPYYRGGRTHDEFLTNLHVSSSVMKPLLMQAWHADEAFDGVPHKRVRQLVEGKYMLDDWNFKF